MPSSSALEQWGSEERRLFAGSSFAGELSAAACAYILLGPPGSGKTSVTEKLSKERWPAPIAAYFERPELNPNLRLSNVPSSSKVAQSQKWFLNGYRQFLESRDGAEIILLDQDPRAVVLTYSYVFQRRGLISEQEYREQLSICLEIWDALTRLCPSIRFICLSAPRDVLLKRIEERQGQAVFEQKIIDDLIPRVRMLVETLKSDFPDGVVEYDTAESSVADIVTDVAF